MRFLGFNEAGHRLATFLKHEKPKNRRFSHKNPKIFDFRFNTPAPFPESGTRKRFHVSGMRGIDFSHKITPRNVFFTKIFENFFLRTGSDCYPSKDPTTNEILFS